MDEENIKIEEVRYQKAKQWKQKMRGYKKKNTLN